MRNASGCCITGRIDIGRPSWRLLEILQQFGCLEDLEPTEIGRTVAALRGDNELWLGLALMSGHLDDLRAA